MPYHNKSLKPGRLVVLLTGRFAGKKAVIIRSTEDGTKVFTFLLG